MKRKNNAVISGIERNIVYTNNRIEFLKKTQIKPLEQIIKRLTAQKKVYETSGT